MPYYVSPSPRRRSDVSCVPVPSVDGPMVFHIKKLQVMRIEPKRYTDMNPSLTGGLDHPWVLYIIVYDVGTLRQRQSHTCRLSTTSIARIHAHMHTSDDRPDARPGTRRAPALATASKRQKAEHTCVCALKRRYPHPQAAPSEPKGSPRASRRRLKEWGVAAAPAGAARRSRSPASDLRAGVGKWARLHAGEAW